MSEEKKVVLPGKATTPITWEEDGYTVTRSCSFSAPGDHPTGIGIKLYVKDGILEKVEGNEEHPITKGALPIRLLALPEYVYHKDRIIYPMKRDRSKRGDNTAWERISWDEALDTVTEKALECWDSPEGSNSIITFIGTGREPGSWGTTLCMRVFNSPNLCYVQSGWSCYGPRMAVTSMVLGAPYPELDYAAQFPDSYDDPRWKPPGCVLLWGKEPLKSNPDGFWGHSLADLMKLGTKFITVDPRLTFEAAHSEYWLQLRPGTDAALAMAMLHVIISEDLYDHDFVDKWTFGFEQLAERVATMPASKAAEICGIPEEKIVGAARFFAAADPGAIEWGVAIDQNPNGIQVGSCIMALMTITGCADVPGGDCLGAINIGGLGSGYSDLNPPEKIFEQIGVDEFPAVCRIIQHTHPDTTFDQLETGKPFMPRMGFFTSANPIACPSNIPKRWENALNNLEFNVATDIIMTPTISAVCDMFLPVSTFAERDGYVATNYGACGTWIGGIKKAITVGEAKSDVEIMRLLGQRLRPELWDDYQTDIEYFNKQKLITLGITIEDLWEHGWYHVNYEYEKYAKGLLRPDGNLGFMTPTGRVELYSTMFESWGDDPLPYYLEPPTSPVSTPEYAKEYPLVLSTGQRTWSYFHSEGRHISKWREVEPNPLVEINPKDAEKYGIIHGDWVILENDNGKCKMMASVEPGQKEGTVCAQHGWWYPEREASAPELYGVYEVNINNLTPYKTVGKLGFGAPYKCLMCKMYKA